MINVRLREGQDWRANAALTRTWREADAALAGKGRVLIRASGTEPVLRVMGEANEAAVAAAFARQLAEAAQAG
jgi:phosphoglucosamine mutase